MLWSFESISYLRSSFSRYALNRSSTVGLPTFEGDRLLSRRSFGSAIDGFAQTARCFHHLPSPLPDGKWRRWKISRNVPLPGHRRPTRECLPRLTLDFDGSVQSTKGHAEGTAVGFNKKKKGARSYYPLFCTVSQTSQFFDVYHRPGNVHDSNGADQFITQCFDKVKEDLKNTIFESRMDSAFFNETILSVLDSRSVKFTASVPFARFPQLKEIIENRKRWRTIDREWSYFESKWKPKSWDTAYRIIITRRKNKKPIKALFNYIFLSPGIINSITKWQ